jgi:hypothetical protein
MIRSLPFVGIALTSFSEDTNRRSNPLSTSGCQMYIRKLASETRMASDESPAKIQVRLHLKERYLFLVSVFRKTSM